MEFRSAAALTLFTREGQRKYLTPAERARFIDVASRWPRGEVGMLGLTLALTGCRISEALALRRHAIDAGEGYVAIRSLKKRDFVCYRQVPIPLDFAARLYAFGASVPAATTPLWSFSRGRAWQLIKLLMEAAAVPAGPHMTAKGLRHGFGIHAVRTGVPLNLLQRWLGHASLETTAIYTAALGDEEREIASRMWLPEWSAAQRRERPTDAGMSALTTRTISR